ncbi:MAG: hypothetical protein E7194_01465 [Erysipelotrichaceae bacterium]|nr:hypothetical protein [Erysipelotrichaceae bacterium]
MKKRLSILLCVCLLCGCGSNTSQDTAETETPAPTEETSAETQTPEAETAAETEAPADESAAQNESGSPVYACRTFDFYDYAKPVPASANINDDYYQDVMIAGDSRVGSLYLFTDLRDKGAEIWYTTSISLWRIYDLAPDEGSDEPMFDLIMDTERSSIYILIGINEIRNNNFDAWGEEFSAVIDELLTKHADDSIYLILNYQPRSLSNIDDASLREHVEEQNSRLKKIAEEKRIYYIDISDEMTDGNGLVKEELVWDGLHFNIDGAKQFADYLGRHVVREDNYVKEICE